MPAANAGIERTLRACVEACNIGALGHTRCLASFIYHRER
jgi:hypothetical protein